jgi:hypothetical protein
MQIPDRNDKEMAEEVKESLASTDNAELLEELNNIQGEDAEELSSKANKILERHSFRDVLNVYSIMYSDAFLASIKETESISAETKSIAFMVRDSFDMQALCEVYVEAGLAAYRNDQKYFSSITQKKGAKTDGVYERLDRLFKNSHEKFPRIQSLKGYQLAPGVSDNLWRHYAMALDALVRRDGWIARAHYVKQVVMNATLIGIFYRNGGEELYKEERPCADCIKAILAGTERFNKVVLDEILNYES